MKRVKSYLKPIFASSTLAGLLMTLPLSSAAETVKLVSEDGSINIDGEIRGFEDGEYIFETNLGEVRIEIARVRCVGEACPDLSVVAPQDGPITWNVSLWGGRRAFTEHLEMLSERVAQRTDGDFIINLVYGGLASSNENLDGIAEGKFEMAQFCAGYHPDKNPAITVLELPFLGVASMEEERAVSQAVYEHPAVVEDMARWNATILMPTPQPQYNILGVGSPPLSLAAFETMTIRATGGTGDAISALGGSPVNLPAPQVNAALTQGDINAVAFAPHGHMAFNTLENAVWWTSNLNPGTANCPVVVNNDALDALPTSSRIALLSSVDEALDHFIDNYKAVTLTAWDATLSERQIMQLTLNDDILNAISNEVAGPSARAWIEEKEALGLPAQELYDLVNKTLADMR